MKTLIFSIMLLVVAAQVQAETKCLQCHKTETTTPIRVVRDFK
jgi:hypothetical protein